MALTENVCLAIRRSLVTFDKAVSVYWWVQNPNRRACGFNGGWAVKKQSCEVVPLSFFLENFLCKGMSHGYN